HGAIDDMLFARSERDSAFNTLLDAGTLLKLVKPLERTGEGRLFFDFVDAPRVAEVLLRVFAIDFPDPAQRLDRILHDPANLVDIVCERVNRDPERLYDIGVDIAERHLIEERVSGLRISRLDFFGAGNLSGRGVNLR